MHHQRHDRVYYYAMRSKRFSCPIERAARFIYLNRTCWNELYRVNRLGDFNVPIGTKIRVVLPTDNFLAVSTLLSSGSLEASDFASIIDRAEKNDFIFADPPYTVKHSKNGFIKYNEQLFSWDDQVRLRDALVNAAARGATFLLTNAHHPSITELYADLPFCRVINRSSLIAASSKDRSIVDEVVVRSWN